MTFIDSSGRVIRHTSKSVNPRSFDRASLWSEPITDPLDRPPPRRRSSSRSVRQRVRRSLPCHRAPRPESAASAQRRTPGPMTDHRRPDLSCLAGGGVLRAAGGRGPVRPGGRRDRHAVQGAGPPAPGADRQSAGHQPGPGVRLRVHRPAGLAQPTVSHHLKKLVAAGLLDREQRGTWAYSSLNRDAHGRLAAVADL